MVEECEGGDEGWSEETNETGPSLCVHRSFARSALGRRVAVCLAVNKTNREILSGSIPPYLRYQVTCFLAHGLTCYNM